MAARPQQQQQQVVALGLLMVLSRLVVVVDSFAPPFFLTAPAAACSSARRRCCFAATAPPPPLLQSSSSSSSEGGGDDDEMDSWFADFDPSEFDERVDEAVSFGGGGGGGGDRRYGQDRFASGRGGNRGGGGAGYTRDASRDRSNVDVAAVESLIADRARARQTGDFDRADALRDALLAEHGVQVWDRDRVWRSGCSASGSGARFSSGRGGDRGGDRGGGGRGGRPSRRQDFGPKGHDYRMVPDAGPPVGSVTEDAIDEMIAERLQCKLSRNFREADAIQNELADLGVFVDDANKEWRADGVGPVDARSRGGGRGRAPPKDFGPTGHDYSMAPDAGPITAEISEDEINQLIADRLQCKLSRNYREADRLQEELRSRGVYVHDGRKEWRADGQLFGDSSASSRSDRNRPYEQSEYSSVGLPDEQLREICSLVARRSDAKLSRDYDLADELRAQLMSDHSVFIDDRLRQWSVGGDFGEPNTGRNGNNARDRPFVRRGGGDLTQDEVAEIADLVQQRADAKKRRDFDTADSIRDALESRFSVKVDDRSREWRVLSDDYAMSREGTDSTDLDDETIAYIQQRLKERSECKKNREYDAADEIRDELRTEYSVSIDDRTREWSLKVSEYTVVENSYDTGWFRSPSPSSEMQEDEDDNDVDEDDNDVFLFDLGADTFSEMEEDETANDDNMSEMEEDETANGDNMSDQGADKFSEMKEDETANGDDKFSEESDLSNLTVVQLKDRLREAGLPVSGKKSELIERLTLAE